jgi:hypothetical protein
MPVLDFHTHVLPDGLASRAMPRMEAEAGVTAAFDGTLAGLRAAMRAASVDVAVIQPVATKPSQVVAINDWVAASAGPDIVAFGAMHPDFEDPPGEMERMSSLGIRGVKLHPEFQRCSPLDERMSPIYEAASRNGLVVLFHAGIDIAIDTLSGTPEVFAELVRSYPDLRLVLAHMGGFRLWDDVERHIVGLPVYLDTSYSLGHMPEERFTELVRSHGVERVLFGSDAPWADIGEELAAIRATDLSAEELDRVLWGNAVQLLAL